MPVSGVTYKDAYISCIYLPFTDMPQKYCARTYRDVKAEGDNTSLYTNLSSIKWILKALLFRKKGTKPKQTKQTTTLKTLPTTTTNLSAAA